MPPAHLKRIDVLNVLEGATDWPLSEAHRHTEQAP